MLADPMEPRASELQEPCRAASQIFRHSFTADPHAVRAALRAALARFTRQLAPDDAGTLELVLAEVMNNIVEHSYADSGQGTITLSIVRGRHGLSCAVSDDGVPLPPDCLSPSLPRMDRGTENLPEGGFGWFLIRDLTHDLGYRRERGKNFLAFTLPLSDSSSAA